MMYQLGIGAVGALILIVGVLESIISFSVVGVLLLIIVFFMRQWQESFGG